MDLLVTQPCCVINIYKDSLSFEIFTFWESHKLNVYFYIHARPIKDSHPGFSAVFHYCRIFCLIYTIFIAWTLQRSSRALVMGIVSAYERSLPNHQIFICTRTTINTQHVSGQPAYFNSNGSFHCHSFP